MYNNAHRALSSGYWLCSGISYTMKQKNSAPDRLCSSNCLRVRLGVQGRQANLHRSARKRRNMDENLERCHLYREFTRMGHTRGNPAVARVPKDIVPISYPCVNPCQGTQNSRGAPVLLRIFHSDTTTRHSRKKGQGSNYVSRKYPCFWIKGFKRYSRGLQNIVWSYKLPT